MLSREQPFDAEKGIFSSDGPLAVAHRAGNDLRLLREAEAARVDLVEVDVWLHRGQVEVRHLRRFPRSLLPLLVGQWRVERGWGKQLTLADVLAASAPATRLMLDMKGVDIRLAPTLIEVMAALQPERQYAVVSRRWALLEAFRDHGHAFVIHAAGDERELRDVRRQLTWHDHHAVAVNHLLLTAERVSELRASAPTLLAWTVNDQARMRQLVDWGVNGIISDRLDVLRAARGMREGAPG